MVLYAVVILYCPDENILRNIKSYIHHVDKLYVMDNSPECNSLLKEKIKKIDDEKIIYIFNGGNKGIAIPINIVISKMNTTMENSWILTMDQDSYFWNDSFRIYKEGIKKIKENVYAISPKIYYEKPERIHVGEDFLEIEKCIQSGAIYNARIAKELGGFCEDFFIDGVDNEYCYKCNDNGYILLRCNTGILIHELGNKIKNGLGKLLGLSQHSPLRRYYIVRNNLYIKDKYKKKRLYTYAYLIAGLFKILCFDSQKKEKFKYALKGYADYKKGIKGEYRRGK